MQEKVYAEALTSRATFIVCRENRGARRSIDRCTAVPAVSRYVDNQASPGRE